MAGWTVDEFFAPVEPATPPTSQGGMSPEEFFAPIEQPAPRTATPPTSAPAPTPAAPIKTAPAPETEDAGLGLPFLNNEPPKSPPEIPPTTPISGDASAPIAGDVPLPRARPAGANPPPAPPIAGSVPLPRARPVEFGPPVPREEEGPPVPPTVTSLVESAPGEMFSPAPTPTSLTDVWDKLSLQRQLSEQLKSGIETLKQVPAGTNAAALANQLSLFDRLDAGEPLPSDPTIPRWYGDPKMRASKRSEYERLFGEQIADIVKSRQNISGAPPGVGKFKDAPIGFGSNPRAGEIVSAANDGDWRKVWDVFKSDPIGILQQFSVQSAPVSAPMMAAGMAGGLAGGPMVAAMSSLFGSYATEFGPRVVDNAIAELQRRKVDINDADKIAAALRSDPSIMESAAKSAGRGAWGPAITDAVSLGGAGGLSRGLGILKNAARVGKNTALELASEPLGEFIGQILEGDGIKPGEILAELLGAGPQVVSTTAIATASEARRLHSQGRDKKAIELALKALDQAIEGSKFKTPAAAAAMQGFSPNPATEGAPGEFPNQPITDRPVGSVSGVSPEEIRSTVDAAAAAPTGATAPPTSESDVAAVQANVPEQPATPSEETKKPEEPTAQEAEYPPASPRESEILKAYGYDDADIANMPHAQRAAEVASALEAGIREPKGVSRKEPIDLTGPEALSKAEALVDEDHTHAQAEGRNRPLVHATWGGLPLSIEAKSGGTRKMQVPETGEPITQKVGATYGYFKGTKGGDGQEVDVAIGPHLAGNKIAYVLDEGEKSDPGKFRQHKVFIGVRSEREARDIYTRFEGKDAAQIQGVTRMPLETFTEWLDDKQATTRPASEFAGAPVGEQAAPQQAGEGLAPPSPAAPLSKEEATRNLVAAKEHASRVKRDLDRIEASLENPRKGKNSLEQLRLDEAHKRQEGIARSLRKKYAEALDAVDDAREATKKATAAPPVKKPEKPTILERPVGKANTAAPTAEELDIPEFLKRNNAKRDKLDEPTLQAAEASGELDPAKAIENAYVNELKSSGLVTEDEIRESLGDAALEPEGAHEPVALTDEPSEKPAEAEGGKGDQAGEHGGAVGESKPSGQEGGRSEPEDRGKPEAGENAAGGEGRPVVDKKLQVRFDRTKVASGLPLPEGSIVLEVNPKTLIEAHQATDKWMAEYTKTAGVRKFVSEGGVLAMPEVGVDHGRIGFTNGRNRTKVAAEEGLETIPVAVDKDNAGDVLRVLAKYGPTVAEGAGRPVAGKKQEKAELRARVIAWVNEGKTVGDIQRALRGEGVPNSEVVRATRMATHYAEQAAKRKPKAGPNEKPTPAKPQKQWKPIGKNRDGVELYEDERGVRSILNGDIRHTEPVVLRPTREGIKAEVRNRRDEYLTEAEYAAANPPPSPVPSEAGPAQQPNPEKQSSYVEGLDIPDGYTVGQAERVKDQGEALVKGGEWTAVAQRESPWRSERGYGDTALAAQRNALDRAIGIVYRLKMPQSDLEVWVVKNADGKRYNVVMRDTDAGKTLPVISIFNSLGAARAEADDILHKARLSEQSGGESETKPAAQPEAKPEAKQNVFEKSAESIKDPLVRALYPIVREGKKITQKQLQLEAEKAYGSSLSEGKFTRKDIYDALEVAVNRAIAHDVTLHIGNIPHWKSTYDSLDKLLGNLPTQTVRSEEQQQFQQFSTPPTYSMAAAFAANIRDGDVVLEPSAGTGSLVAAASHPGATIYANELSPRRAALLRSFDDVKRVFTENAEQLNNVLPDDVRPTVVVMNPPFSQTAGRMRDKKDLMAGANHVRQAYKRLQPGGRLVAIVGRGMTPGSARYASFWNEIPKDGTLVANIGVDGKVYSKYGTSFGTRLLVIDKAKREADFKTVAVDVDSIEQLMPLLEKVRGLRAAAVFKEPRQGDARPSIEPKPAEQAGETLAPTDQPLGGPGQPVPSNAGAVGPGRGSKRGLAEPGPIGAGVASGATSGLEPGQRDVVAPVEPQRTGQAGAGQEPDIRPATGEKPEGGSAQGAERDIQPATGGQSSAPTSGVSPVEKLVVEQAKPGSQTASEITDSLYEAYQPRKLKIQGAKGHPGPLVESAAMASVDPPSVNYSPSLPKTVVKNGLLSLPQLEAVVYAGQAHGDLLPAAEDAEPVRKGFFIGDGTGVGKGREISGIILDNWQQGRTKAIWVSEKKKLLSDARRDWGGLEQDPKTIFDMGNVKSGESITAAKGIAFVTYDTLKGGLSDQAAIARGGFVRGQEVKIISGVPLKDDLADRAGSNAIVTGKGVKSGSSIVYPIKFSDGATAKVAGSILEPVGEAKTVKSRVDQIVEWVGKDFDGVIAFDEAHNMGNALAMKGDRGVQDASQKALSGVALQAALPKARVVYVSATGATEVYNLAYADRLGLWGRGTSFADKTNFINEVQGGGIAAMEIVARDMKQLGVYMARNLSYDDGTPNGRVEYDRLEHKLSSDQREIYDTCAEAWHVVLQNIEAALEATGGKENKRARTAALSAFWGTHQRFFNQVITSLQMPSVIKAVEADLAAGRQAVLQLTNTNEASQERAVAKVQSEEELEDLDITPRDQLIQLVEKSFPTQQFETYVDENGNERTRAVLDSAGKPVQNAEAVEMRDALIERISSIRVPQGPLDMILDHFGADVVAEVTGRKRRFIFKEDDKGNRRRMEDSRPGSANENETNAFQAGKKKVLVFSEAGGTGASYHADNTAASKGARRSHYLVQAGWRADKAVQGFGRTHRTNQASAPIFHLVTTDLDGQKRFISSIARRLAQLGALTKGQRQAGDQGIFSARDNLESDEARLALRQFLGDLAANRVEGLDVDTFEKQTGLSLRQKTEDGGILGVKTDHIDITQFLNRLLSLKIDTQNRTFAEFSKRLDGIIEYRAAAGLLDSGLETVRAGKIEKKNETTVYTDEKTGAETKHVELQLSDKLVPLDFRSAAKGKDFVKWVKSPKGRVYAVQNAASVMSADTGSITPQYRLVGPISSRLAPQAAIEGWRSEWTQISPAEAEGMWGNEVAAAPEFTTRRMHLITGAILPIWDRLKGSTRVVRLNTAEGERMIGRVIPNSAIGDTLKALGASATQSSVTPQEVYNRIMAGGSVVLANRWRLSRRLVAGQHRIELTGPASWSEGQQVKSDGVFTERIGYTTRYFVPADETYGPKVIAKLTEFRPVSEISGGESEVASLGGYDINQAERNIELKRLYSQERILMSRYVERPSEDLVREFEALSERIAALEGRSREAVHSQQAIKAAGRWTEAHKAQIAADVAGIVRRVVGDNVRLNTPETHRVSNLKGWGASSGSTEVAGAMRLSEALLTVSIGPKFANANQTAYHEAYHAIEGLLQTDQERALMERETPQLRQYLRDFAKTGALAGITADEVEHLAGYEVRAIMFELYGHSTDKFSGGSAVRRFFLKVYHIAQRFMRVLRMRGFRGWEDVFEAAYHGEFAGRAARPIAERTLGSDAPEAAARRKMTPAKARALPGPQVGHERVSEALNDPNLTAVQRIREAMSAATLPVSRATWDRIIDLYRFQRAAEIANGGAKTPAGLDAHLAATLFTGRTGSRFKEFKRLRIDPILDAMAERGISMDDMNSYLYARHAQERNAAIAAIDPTNLEGSGMSDTDAATILSDFAASGMTADLDAVASMVDTVLLDNRNMLVAAGLEDPNTIAAWTNAYQNYVPLKGSEMGDDEWGTPYAGKGYSINGPESMRALGRHSRAGDIMANVFDQSMRSIVRAEKNRVALAFYRFAKANPSPWYKMGLAERRRHIDPLTGLVAWQTVTTDRNADSAFSVKIGGKAHYVQIMHPGLLAALKDLGGEQMNGFFRATAKFTRMYSSLQTAKNPEFVLTNLLRDLADAGLNMTAEQQRGFKRAFARNILSGKAFAAAFLGESRDASGTGKIAQAIEAKAPGLIRYYDEWQAAGGKISMYGLKDIQSLADELRRDMRRANEGVGKRALMALPRAPGSLIKLFEGISDITESMTRLAVYAAAREAGLSPPVAAKAAREMTVDFNAKGQYGRYINALYAFAGPSIIGPTRLMRRLARSKTMRRAAMGVAGLGFVMALWNLWAAPKDDEDKKNRYARMKYWEREKNFVLFIPGWKDGLKIPMGYGVAPFWMIGEEAAMVAMGQTPWSEALGNAIGTIASTFNPLGAEGSAFSLRFWASMATPTILDPVMQLIRNRNWLDRPIHPDRDRVPQGAGLANSEIAKATTSPYAIETARWLNRVSGGTPYASHAGKLDFYPDDLQFVWNFALGGLGAFALRSFDMFKDLRDGVDTPVERIPFVRRFAVPGESEGMRASEYYESAHKVSEDAASYRAASKQQGAEAKQVRQELSPRLKPYTGERGGQHFSAEDVFKGSNEALKRLRANEARVRKDNTMTPVERSEALKRISERRLDIMRRTNRLYEKRYGAP